MKYNCGNLSSTGEPSKSVTPTKIYTYSLLVPRTVHVMNVIN